ncbi:recombinase family protein [Streptomyces sp. NPDC005407]|uniref:recombinase family protein n=1 Tax=Streptomyces sp. NPDC005407 TaxID=3155340 RepID=UPI0033B57510
MTKRRAAIYCRISNDKEGGGLGVARQEEDCRLLAAALGWHIVDVYVDNDVSAADRRKVRDEYQRMMDDIKSGRVDSVVSWHTDRLHRQPRELEDFIDLVETQKVEINTVKAGVLDLTTPSGRMTARVHAAIAKHEVEHKRERVLRKVEELALEGKIHNGGHRPFGYTRIYEGEGSRRKVLRDEINEKEAEIVRECAQRILEGETLYAIVKSLNARKIKSSTGRTWTQQALRYLLISGRIAGLKEHRRQVVGKAQWPPIITEEEHQLIRALLTSPNRNTRKLRAARVYHLSGLVRCACAPEHIKMKVRKGSDRKTMVYACPAKGEGGCGGRTIKVEELERLMRKLALRELDEVEDLAEQGEPGPTMELEQQIDRWERRLNELKAAFAESDQSASEYRDVTQDLRKRIDAARLKVAKYQVRQLARVEADELKDAWKDLPFERKRAIFTGLYKEILIYPATRPFNVFNPARVVPVPLEL